MSERTRAVCRTCGDAVSSEQQQPARSSRRAARAVCRTHRKALRDEGARRNAEERMCALDPVPQPTYLPEVRLSPVSATYDPMGCTAL